MKSNLIKISIFCICSLLLIFVDQFTKKLATKYLLNKEPIIVIDGILELVYTENQGAAFGILQNRFEFFYVITILVLFIIIYLLVKTKLTLHNIPYFIFLVLIFSGAVGNFIDRVKNKSVVDFIYFKPIDFPVFNFADILITCGCIVLIISTLTIYRKE